MLLESSFLLKTPSYYLLPVDNTKLLTVLTGLLLTPIRQPLGPCFLDPYPMVTSLFLSSSCTFFYYPMMASYSFFPSSCLRNLNPTYVPSGELQAVGIFIYQSQLAGDRVTQHFYVQIPFSLRYQSYRPYSSITIQTALGQPTTIKS